MRTLIIILILILCFGAVLPILAQQVKTRGPIDQIAMPKQRMVTIPESQYIALLEDYRKLKNQAQPTSGELAYRFAAVKGVRLGMGLPIWIIALIIIRALFRKLWDADLTGRAWPSAAVVCAVILGTAIVTYGLVS